MNKKALLAAKTSMLLLTACLPLQYIGATNNSMPSVMAQGKESVIKGTVKDAKGEPLIGVSVVVKNVTGVGVVTDMDGNFNIKVADKNAKLVFSYVGFTSQEVPLAGRTTLNIILKEESSMLNEVVVTAMGLSLIHI